MTPGQDRALRELRRIRACSNGTLDFDEPTISNGWLVVPISVRIGPIEHRDGGLKLRERESFWLEIPKDFPFDKPELSVYDDRFKGRPHVTWNRWLCLYQSGALEWNPSDGLYGYMTRLSIWLGKAAANNMDAEEGPLHPPHNDTDYKQLPFLFRTNSPAPAGDVWVGFAQFQKHSNHCEVTAWHKPGEVPGGVEAALTVILPKPLPMEYPRKGSDFFGELAKQALDREVLLGLLQWAAQRGDAEAPVYLVLGAPSRRGPDGTPRQHFAVWSIDLKKYLKSSSPSVADSVELATLRKDLGNSVVDALELSTLKWCPVFDDRPEIVVRRDKDRPMAYFEGKRVLVLGAGALGSWAAELIARASPVLLHIVDGAQVKPGLLVRQNYALDEIGAPKATALAKRLSGITKATVEGFETEARKFLLADLIRTASYDLIVDCTASRTLHMRLEHDWEAFGGKTPRLVSFVTDARAERIIGIELAAGSPYGPWVGYLQLKNRISRSREIAEAFLDAFYSDKSIRDLFQPEPGCSDPTFAGSAADSSAAAASFLNITAVPSSSSRGYALSGHPQGAVQPPTARAFAFDELQVEKVGDYRVCIAPSVLESARLHVKDNGRRRSKKHETGGLLWGYWDDAAKVIVVFEASGPPPDSTHSPARFVCGTQGTRAQHAELRFKTRDACGFVGMWHTHPDMAPRQSGEDVVGMASLVAGTNQNQRRAIMLIFGRERGKPEVGIYVYESMDADGQHEQIQFPGKVIALSEPVV